MITYRNPITEYRKFIINETLNKQKTYRVKEKEK